MQKLDKIRQALSKEFGTAVTATEANGVIFLDGSLDEWQDVVRAGQLAADKKRGHYLVNHIKCNNSPPPPMKSPQLKDDYLADKSFDVVVIGAGIVGCAIARELRRYDISVLLCEKEHDVALQASGRNDGMVHPGIDLKKGQIKRAYNLRGNSMYDEVCTQLDVPFKRTGQYLCFDKSYAKYVLPIATLYWTMTGIPCEYISREKLFSAEPMLSQKLTCGLRFSTAGIVCPYNLTIAYAENAVDNGAKLSLDTAVLGMEVKDGKILSLLTNRGTVHPRVVINAAGVFSDAIARMAGDEFFSIHPRRGTNSILDKKSAYQIKTIASTIGTASTKSTHSKGGGMVSTVDGNLLIGPDAVETCERENFATSAQSINAIFQKQGITSPSLSTGDIITYFTGVRAATYEEDFVIEAGRSTQNIVHAAGIQSPGLTAAPAIAVDVANMTAELLKKERPVQLNKSFNPVRIGIPRTAELADSDRDLLIQQNPDYGVIICRCEEVSRGEILDSLRRSVPCDTIDGVKRRTRPGMGRCKGGFCGPLVADIIAKEKGVPLSGICKSGDGSNLVYSFTKGGELGTDSAQTAIKEGVTK